MIERDLRNTVESGASPVQPRDLEQRVHDRTADLERSNAALERFACVAAHDLQAPLNTVIGYVKRLERLRQDQLDEESIEAISIVVGATERMQQLIHSVLAYSRLNGGTIPDEPTDSAAALKQAMENLAVEIAQTGALIQSGPLPPVYVDPIQLMQLFQNLIHNAIKFTADHSPVIQISALRRGDEWCFAVADNGIGIVPEDTKRVFNLFERLHGRDQYPGSGIGLAICKRIVDLHGGTIWMESKPGEGATVYFAFPNCARPAVETRFPDGKE
jgi:chemotaxis family two-component system sensor kinase Cph1